MTECGSEIVSEWEAGITYPGIYHYTGHFDDPVEAVGAVLLAALDTLVDRHPPSAVCSLRCTVDAPSKKENKRFREVPLC